MFGRKKKKEVVRKEKQRASQRPRKSQPQQRVAPTEPALSSGTSTDEERIAVLKEAFDMFDKNGDGTITIDELREVMKSVDRSPTDAELVELITSVDRDGDNEIDFQEFLVLMESNIGRRDAEMEISDAFRVFDLDGSGSISRGELEILMSRLGQNLSEAQVDEMMKVADTDGNGEISFEEFRALALS